MLIAIEVLAYTCHPLLSTLDSVYNNVLKCIDITIQYCYTVNMTKYKYITVSAYLSMGYVLGYLLSSLDIYYVLAW